MTVPYLSLAIVLATSIAPSATVLSATARLLPTLQLLLPLLLLPLFLSNPVCLWRVLSPFLVY